MNFRMSLSKIVFAEAELIWNSELSSKPVVKGVILMMVVVDFTTAIPSGRVKVSDNLVGKANSTPLNS